MNWSMVCDVLSAACLLVGSAFTLVAAIGQVRMPDLLSRMHPATKPQVLGLLFVLIGIALSLRTTASWGLLVLVALFQLVTTPVASHMVGRAAVRSGHVDRSRLVVDDLGTGPADTGRANNPLR